MHISLIISKINFVWILKNMNKIGFIGVGNMGNPMARNLLEAGFPVVVHDLRPASAENLIKKGAKWAESPEVVAHQTDAVITMLPNPAAVESVLLGEKGLLKSLSPNSTWIDCTTNSPTSFQRIAEEAISVGVKVLEAPVTNAVDGAERGELIFFVGGELEVFEQAKPILEPMAEQIFYAGGLGTGNITKLITNMLWFVNACAIGEALVIGAKAGIPLPNLSEMIQASAGNSWVAEHDIPSIFAGHYDPSFTIKLCVKDLRLIDELAQKYNVPLMMGNQARSIFQSAQAKYGHDKGEMSVVKLLEDIVGVSLQINQVSKD
ncbi:MULTISPECIES: NAD(P)-dependent oxidoreductase [unclassified Moorena]|uniref:NAD(P)-dependent oxidoreductase n=1 Tax=unclassified Moorena TaxID=2683338 RepID=UPI0013FF7787|nr:MULTISPECIES: NAD(P)-dependent oxidoreductase [unclassified Moorena]NEO13240.1 NAD(P)-dependent oxidoreductase [Moorena sp. SIO3E8]NEP98580.1 NAD(P)-dependent oxidoreductase [Moorena sp. SIO3F7]